MLKLMMQSRINAALFAVLFSVGLLVFPLVFVLSIATLSLVSLQKDLSEGMIVALIASGILVVVTILFGGQIQSLSFLLFISWLPVIVMSVITKKYGDISQGLKAGFVLALIALSFLYILSGGNSEQYWLKFFNANLEPILLKLNMPDELFAQFKTALTVNMNGLLTSSIILLVVLGLIIGRYWQAKLYKPGAFGEEFRQITFGKTLGLITILVLIAGSLSKDVIFFTDLQRGFILLFMLQGLAVVHYLVKDKQYGTGVLSLTYCVILLLPIVSLFITAMGIMDNWFNFRRAFRSSI